MSLILSHIEDEEKYLGSITKLDEAAVRSIILNGSECLEGRVIPGCSVGVASLIRSTDLATQSRALITPHVQERFAEETLKALGSDDLHAIDLSNPTAQQVAALAKAGSVLRREIQETHKTDAGSGDLGSQTQDVEEEKVRQALKGFAERIEDEFWQSRLDEVHLVWVNDVQSYNHGSQMCL